MSSLGVLEENQVVFPKLGLDIEISDTAFTIAGLEIKWYGIFITVGLLLAVIYAFKNMKSYGIDPDRAIDVIIGGVLGGLVGARAYYVLLNWDSYSGDIASIFNIRNGGLAIYGGIIGAVLVAAIVAKFKKVKLLPLLDIAGVGFLLGQGIGRWGNFTNQEAFGCNTETLFGMSSGKIQQWIAQYGNTATLPAGEVLEVSKPVHPCFLYESVWCLLGFVVLAILAKKIRKFDGQIFLMYAAWYGLGRFFIEGLRIDSLMIGSLRVSQGLAAVCFVASVVLLIVFSLKVRRMGDDYKLYCDTKESKALLNESEENTDNESKDITSENEETTDDTEESKDSAEINNTVQERKENTDTENKEEN